ncbi:hypothetical protein QBK99_20415 [Corticibacterium sp. UT-5YL-CI-8]|nr:hypothetical protein [Tianweitania sp. UT-5YL-CI-8]
MATSRDALSMNTMSLIQHIVNFFEELSKILHCVKIWLEDSKPDDEWRRDRRPAAYRSETDLSNKNSEIGLP